MHEIQVTEFQIGDTDNNKVWTFSVEVLPEGFCIPDFGLNPDVTENYTIEVNQAALTLQGSNSAINGCTYTEILQSTTSTIFTTLV